jgi:hypothetical protein
MILTEELPMPTKGYKGRCFRCGWVARYRVLRFFSGDGSYNGTLLCHGCRTVLTPTPKPKRKPRDEVHAAFPELFPRNKANQSSHNVRSIDNLPPDPEGLMQLRIELACSDCDTSFYGRCEYHTEREPAEKGIYRLSHVQLRDLKVFEYLTPATNISSSLTDTRPSIFDARVVRHTDEYRYAERPYPQHVTCSECDERGCSGIPEYPLCDCTACHG